MQQPFSLYIPTETTNSTPGESNPSLRVTSRVFILNIWTEMTANTADTQEEVQSGSACCFSCYP